MNKYFVWCESLSILMGDLRRDGLLGPRELLAIAVTEREIYNIRLLFCKRHFYRKVILIGKCSIGLLAMCFVSGVNALRILTLVLLSILVGLSFYLIFQSLQRCEALTICLNEEIRDVRNLMQNSDSEEWTEHFKSYHFTSVAKIEHFKTLPYHKCC